MNLRRIACSFLGLLSLFAATDAQPAAKIYNFPIYKNNPAGKQISGQFAPASTPALSPEESRKKFVVPPGFEVRLFAARPHQDTRRHRRRRPRRQSERVRRRV